MFHFLSTEARFFGDRRAFARGACLWWPRSYVRRYPVPPPLPKTTAETPRPWFASLKGSFEHTPRTLGLVWQSARVGTLLFGLLTLASAVIPLAIAWAGKQIIDAVVRRS